MRTYRQLTLLIISLFMPLAGHAEIEPDGLTAIPGLVRTYVANYVYDDAGNVTRINYRVLLGAMNSTEEEEDEVLVDEPRVSIRTDEAWKNVAISTMNTRDDGRMSLSIYNMSGANCYECGLEDTGHATLDLSFLPKGVYLFHISTGTAVENYKLIKR